MKSVPCVFKAYIIIILPTPVSRTGWGGGARERKRLSGARVWTVWEGVSPTNGREIFENPFMKMAFLHTNSPY